MQVLLLCYLMSGMLFTFILHQKMYKLLLFYTYFRIYTYTEIGFYKLFHEVHYIIFQKGDFLFSLYAFRVNMNIVPYVCIIYNFCLGNIIIYT